MSQETTNHTTAHNARTDLAVLREMIRNDLLATLSAARTYSLRLPTECRSLLMDDLSAQLHPDGRNDNITESFGRAESWCDAELETEAGERPMTPSAPI